MSEMFTLGAADIGALRGLAGLGGPPPPEAALARLRALGLASGDLPTELGTRVAAALAHRTPVLRATVAPTMTAGAATLTIALDEAAPLVVGRDGADRNVQSLVGVDEATILVAGHVGIGDPPEPVAGPAADLSAAAWAGLVHFIALRRSSVTWAELVAAPIADDRVAAAMLRVAPTVDLSKNRERAVQGLVAAGLVVGYEGELTLSDGGRDLVSSLANATSVGRITLDAPVAGGSVRLVDFTTIRTADRFFMGAWSLVDGRTSIVLGQPGPAAMGILRGVMRARVAHDPVAAVPPPVPTRSARAPSTPRLHKIVMAIGGIVAIGAVVVGVRSGSQQALGSDDAVTTVATQATTTTTQATTTTTIAPSTTAVPTTTSTTTSTTSTTSTTTTTLAPVDTGVLVTEFDANAPIAVPVFSEAAMEWSVTPDGFGRLQANTSGILPAVFDPEFDDALMVFTMRLDGATVPEARGGAVLRTDAADDGVLSRYVFVTFSPVEQTALLGVFTDGEFTTVQSIPLPTPFAVGGSNTVEVRLVGTTVEVTLNGVGVGSFSDVGILPEGRVGFVVFGSENATEVLLVDTLTVLSQ